MNEIVILIQGLLGHANTWVIAWFKAWVAAKFPKFRIEGGLTLVVGSMLGIGEALLLDLAGIVAFTGQEIWMTVLIGLGVTQGVSIYSWELLKKWIMEKLNKPAVPA